MARYTFAVGNLAKLLRLPLYALGALVSLVVPRRADLWAYGSGIGVGEGSAALYRAARERLPEVRHVWLATTRAELDRATALGFDAILKSSWTGFVTTLRARVLAVTHGFGDVNRYGTRGGFVVQLWHGVPLKRLHADSPESLRISGIPDRPLVRHMLRWAYLASGRGISLFPVASEVAAARVRTAFGVRAENVVVTGDPRDDVLFESSRDDARALIEPIVGALPPKVLLYAPTWRDGRRDPSAPTATEWTAIAARLERDDAALLIRSHPHGLGDYLGGPATSPRIRLLGARELPDLTPALPAVDVLVTDYSSVAFDFSLLGRPTVFLAPDVADYAARRGLYTPYRDFSGGREVADWAGVLAALDSDGTGHARFLRDETFDLEGGGATARVLDEILHRLGETDAQNTHFALRPRPQVAAEWTEHALRLVIPGVRGARLEGRRTAVDGIVGGDTVSFPLLQSRWGGPELPLPSGGYRLAISTGAEHWTRRVAVEAPPAALRTELLRADLDTTGGELTVRISPPLADDERGARNQRRLERGYRTRGPRPERAVFFESFYSQVAADNPYGIDRALAAVRPGVRRYWSVVDRSVAVPDGAIPIVEGSREWWRVRGDARVLVVNDWLRKRFARRRHQRVLQTWHGTPLKRLALDRLQVGLRTRIATRRESARWDALLVQNEYSAGILRRAYAVTAPLWELGYPRSDTRLAADRDAVRDRIGVPRDARAVLYAPTWRDDRPGLAGLLDLPGFAAKLPAGTVLLVRGHSRTLQDGPDAAGGRLIDVTTYPDVADLLAASDVLVTDYASLMFDWVATDRPVVFYVPDLDHYGGTLRGFYFDLVADAPGPVAHDEAALLAALAARDRFAAKRAEWRERFTPRDDGKAGIRVVARMLAEGWLD